MSSAIKTISRGGPSWLGSSPAGSSGLLGGASPVPESTDSILPKPAQCAGGNLISSSLESLGSSAPLGPINITLCSSIACVGYDQHHIAGVGFEMSAEFRHQSHVGFGRNAGHLCWLLVEFAPAGPDLVSNTSFSLQFNTWTANTDNCGSEMLANTDMELFFETF